MNTSTKKEPDILFLDIEMPGIGGMDTAKALRNLEKKMLIIFITAYPDYVFQGYEVHAFHYILKPYEKNKLKEVLENAVKELASQGNNSILYSKIRNTPAQYSGNFLF